MRIGGGGMAEAEAEAEAEEVLRKIQKLEHDHAHLKDLIINGNGSSMLLLESQYENILESMGRTVYMFDANERIVYWNKMAENLYGYTAAEAVGKTAPEIIISPAYSELATLIIQRALHGETWSGQFPVRTKYGDKFSVITTLAPCLDDHGTTFGVTCVCADPRQFLPPHSPDPLPIASNISNLATKVKLKMKTAAGAGAGAGETNMHHHSCLSPASSDGTENRPTFHQVLSLKAEAWMRKTGISWPWKGNQSYGSHNHNHHHQQHSTTQPCERRKESSSATCSSWSINTNSTHDTAIHMDLEISWDALTIREQIGQGLHGSGTVYHALLYGLDVAVKIFTKQEFADDMILSFRKEVSLMKRLRHPNILLLMGAVISPRYLCTVTEFLPRGSLLSLLQRYTTRLDWRRRVHMAIDTARGMNYLHNCQPPIVHRNLKSSNLLVDKNWTLKVGDFGLSRIKHETYLKTNAGAGTAHWMAPEVLRNEQVDEKSDVYSYGVVLWEITTGKIPWENLNSVQVTGAVGFMDQRLEIPNDVHPEWASLIESCWSSEPRSRPTFREILIKLKELQQKMTKNSSCKKIRDGENA